MNSSILARLVTDAPRLLRDLEYVIGTPGTAIRLLLPGKFPVLKQHCRRGDLVLRNWLENGRGALEPIESAFRRGSTTRANLFFVVGRFDGDGTRDFAYRVGNE